ncbi:MAG: radical SAM protein, partial [Patescibacteria group bacterium]|nr:radical SAM protein [Patescibacteria group bacterium]
LPFPAWDLLHQDVSGEPLLERYIETPVWGESSTTKNSSAAPFTMTRSLTIPDSRGCPFNCAFCYRGMQGQRDYGAYGAQRLTAEVEWLIKTYGIDFVGFNSDNFMIDCRRIRDLMPLLSPLGIKWGTHGRMDETADIGQKEKRVKFMAAAGCIYIGFGGESAHPDILDSMGKGGSILAHGLARINGFSFPRTMVEAIRTAKDAGIHGNCTWMMGWPGETLLHLKTTIAFIRWQEEFATQGLSPGTLEYETAKNSINRILFIATAYPGTDMFKMKAVRHKLMAEFGIHFDPGTNQPIGDRHLEEYVLALGDAGKLLFGRDGRPLNFSSMPDNIFIQAQKHVEDDETYRILDL